jgi:hypothetical protein
MATSPFTFTGDPENNDNHKIFFFALPKKEISLSFPPLAVSAAATPFATYYEAVEVSPMPSQHF